MNQLFLRGMIVSLLDDLKAQYPHIGNGLAKGEVCVITPPVWQSRGMFESVLRNRKLEQIGFCISDDPRIHDRIRNDGIEMNRRTYGVLAGSPELYPYYVHNIFRDMFGIEKLYDYEEPPITKVNVPDLRLASACIENFKFVMADQALKLPFKINKSVIVKDGRTEAIVELILLDQ
jgi:hypothetical protein